MTKDLDDLVPGELPDVTDGLLPEAEQTPPEPFPALPDSMFGPILPDESESVWVAEAAAEPEDGVADETFELAPFPALPAWVFGPILPDESETAWPADPDEAESAGLPPEPVEVSEPFPAVPAFLTEPIRPVEMAARRRAGIFHGTRRLLLNGLPGPVTAGVVLVAAGAATAGALHLQDFDIGRVLGLSKAPALRVADAFGREDAPVLLDISVVAQAETVLQPLRISGLPEGITLSAGKRLANGDWSVTNDRVETLVLVPPTNFHGRFDLAVEASALHGEEIKSKVSRLAVEIEAVADVPELAVQDIDGREDGAQPLGIVAALADEQETLSIVIRGLPDGASLSHGAADDDEWIVELGDLDALQVIPAPNFNGSFPLVVDVTAHDDDDTVLVRRGFDVRFAPVADAPILSVDWEPAREDVPVDLKIDVSLRDPKEALSVRVTGLPEGARLSAGTEQSTGVWSVTPDEVSDLRLFLPPHFNGLVPLGVTATTVDGLDRAHTELNRDIDVAAEADKPLVVATDAAGREDAAMPLAVSVIVPDPQQSIAVSFLGLPPGTVLSLGTPGGPGEWQLDSLEDIADLELTPPADYAGVSTVEVVATTVDGDSVAETRTDMVLAVAAVADPAKFVTHAVLALEDESVPLVMELSSAARERVALSIAGVPPAARLSAGEKDEEGVWYLSVEELTDLTLSLPPHFAEDFQLLATATTFDGDDKTTVSASIDVDVVAIADRPSLQVGDVSGAEDQPIALDLAVSSPDPAEFVAVRVSGLPAGATLTAGRDAGGQWQLQPHDLADLALIPPADFSGDIALGVTTVAYHGLSQAAVRGSFVASVEAVADMPVVEVESVAGLEDSVIPITISAHVVDESEHLTLAVVNMPDGASLSHGQRGDDGAWWLDPEDWQDLAFLPPENFSGTARLAVTVTALDGDDSISVTTPLDVTVKPIADRPKLSVEDAIGIEDGIIVFRVDAQTPDPSESLAVRVSGLPQGAKLSAGQITEDGSWVLDRVDLQDLSLIPPGNYSGQLNLLVSATSRDGDSTSSAEDTLDVTLVPVADFPNLTVVSAVGSVSRPLPLNIDAAVTDDGETLDIAIRGLPEGFGLSDGSDRGNGHWVLTPAQLTDLTVIPSGEESIAFALAVSVSATDGSDRKQVTETLEVTFTDPEPADQSARLSLVASAKARELPPVRQVRAEEPKQSEADVVQEPPLIKSAAPEELPVVETKVAALPPVAAAESAVEPALSPAQAGMVARAEEYLAVGDVVAARLLFEATAKLGSAEAAVRAGETYDPIFLEERGFVGALPLPERAKDWYRSALDLGSAQAAERMARLEEWLAGG